MTNAVKPSASRHDVFELKHAHLNVMSAVLHQSDIAIVQAALTERCGQQSDFFDGEPLVLDLANLHATEADLPALISAFAGFGARVFAVRHASATQQLHAQSLGLISLPDDGGRGAKPAAPATAPAAPPAPAPAPVVETRVEHRPTRVIDRPVRTGQQVYAKGGNLVILATVSAGAEVIADGDIHIYAPLRGKALAGASGDTGARIFVQSMHAELVSVAGYYRNIEEALPASIAGQSIQIFLEADKLVMLPLPKD
jgi:septum site-determining protein MinC